MAPLCVLKKAGQQEASLFFFSEGRRYRAAFFLLWSQGEKAALPGHSWYPIANESTNSAPATILSAQAGE
ncbi:hypothetical protein D478_13293 [Brevibacillus agri BAB-2500]|nr:hypothetical protein D478_13293 [Brevibacillus agri BAB-2500]